MHRARVLVSLSAALFVVTTTAAPSAAATPPLYTATFPMEKTVFRACPPGLPAHAVCFTGSDHSGLGTSTPPGSAATEDFAGFIDPNTIRPCPLMPGSFGPVDHNVVTIGTATGSLFLTTEGVSCGGTDVGTWNAIGGTGNFEGASGSGSVQTAASGGSGTQADPIRSSSIYNGALTVHGD